MAATASAAAAMPGSPKAVLPGFAKRMNIHG